LKELVQNLKHSAGKKEATTMTLGEIPGAAGDGCGVTENVPDTLAASPWKLY